MNTSLDAVATRANRDVAASLVATPHVIIASSSQRIYRRLDRALGSHCRLTVASSITDVIRHVTPGRRPIVITTENLQDGDAETLQRKLEETDRRISDGLETACILVTEQPHHERDAQQLADFFYVMAPTLEPSSVLALVQRAAISRQDTGKNDTDPRSHTQAIVIADIISYTRRLASEPTLRGLATAAVDALEGLLGTVRAYCLFHDPDGGELWSEIARSTKDGDDVGPSSFGLSGYAAKTLRSVVVPQLSGDPRFDPKIDDPVAVGNERGLFHPIIGADGTAEVVLVAIRDASSPPFDVKDQRTVCEISRHWTPIFRSHALQLKVQSEIAEAQQSGSPVYRQEALDVYNSPQNTGEVVRVIPHWTGFVYWGLIGILVTAAVLAAIFHIGRYANGVAIVVREDATQVVAQQSGVVGDIHVRSGQRVEAGELLLSFEAQQEEQVLRRLDAEYATAAVNWLDNPSFDGTSAQLARTSAERRAAEEQLSGRQLRAPRAGIIGGLRIESGRPVAAGDLLLSIADADSQSIVLAFLPGVERPHLKKGMPARIRLNGEGYPHQNTVLDYVSDHVLTPDDIGRIVGPGIAQSLQITQPMVLARARLPSREVEVRGKAVAVHSGMQASFEVRIEQSTILKTILHLADLF